MEVAQRSTPEVKISVRTAHTPELLSGLLCGDVDLAVVDLPAQQRGIRTHALSAEPLIAAVPERLNVPKQPAVRLAELNRAPLVLLSQPIDPGRAVIEQALASSGARAFKIHDAASIPELLDEVALQSRFGLVRQSAMRFQRPGVIYKPLSEPVQLGTALAWRVDHRWSALFSFRDALIAFAGQS